MKLSEEFLKDFVTDEKGRGLIEVALAKALEDEGLALDEEILRGRIGETIRGREEVEREEALKIMKDLDDGVPAFVRRTFTPHVKAIDEEKRTVDHLISDDTIDRAGDIVEPLGWELDDFKRNPVVLADHTYSILRIIGNALKVSKSRAGLFARTLFDDMGIGAAAFRLVAEKFARAWSVGFVPGRAHLVRNGADAKCKKCVVARDRQLEGIDPEKREEIWIRGIHFLRQSLLEYSLVAVPMNPNIVNDAVRRHLVEREQVPYLFNANQRDAVLKLVDKILGPSISPSSEARKAKASRDARRVRAIRDAERSLGRLDAIREAERLFDL